VLTATSLSYGEAKNLTPHKIQTPDRIEIKFGTVDCISEGTRHAKFYANFSKGGLLGKWVEYTQKLLFLYAFFLRTHRSDLLRDFTLNMSNDAVLHNEVPFWVRKLKFNI